MRGAELLDHPTTARESSQTAMSPALTITLVGQSSNM